LEDAALEVYKTKMRIYPPTKIVTPYGGRLVWTLPGRTKMIAHLKVNGFLIFDKNLPINCVFSGQK
jgi:hypothetical protein